MWKKFLKSFASGSILAALSYIVLGVILIWKPEISLTTIALVAAGALLLIGIVDIILYMFKDITGGVLNNLLSGGLIMIVLAIFMFLRPEIIVSSIPFLLGLAIILGGVVKLQRSVDLARLKYEGWIFVLLLSAVDIALGIVMVTNPFTAAKTLIIVLGIGLVISGLTTLVTTAIVAHKLKNLNIDATIVEETVEDGQVVDTAVMDAGAVRAQKRAEKKAEKAAAKEQKRLEKEAARLQEKAEKEQEEAERQAQEVNSIVESRLKAPDTAVQETPVQGYVPTYMAEGNPEQEAPDTTAYVTYTADQPEETDQNS